MTDVARDRYFKADQISKEPMPVVIRTPTELIEGEFHVRGTLRMMDEIRFEEKFIAVTKAVIFKPDGVKLLKTNFMAINRDEIIWMAPKKEVESRPKQ
jgi:hypothetical protein